MILGFHYHIPIFKDANNKFFTMSFYGLFLDSLARQTDSMIVFSYSPTPSELGEMNYRLESTNLEVVDLGRHNSLILRFLRFPWAIFLIWRRKEALDCLLIRSPTPLVIPALLLHKRIQIVLYLVGDYIEGAKNTQFGMVKNFLIKALARSTDKAQKSIAKNNLVIANSQALVDQYQSIASRVCLIKSTTLTEEDFFLKNHMANRPIYKILYTGRLDESKGLFEIVEACKILIDQGYSVEFHFAGLIVKGKEGLPDQLIENCQGSPMEKKIFYHGLKKVGTELNKLYRSCDIYVIASKSNYEGFPRTIWEAMANSLPVVASPKGSIGFFLKNEIDSLLLLEVTPQEIAKNVQRLIMSEGLRNTLVLNGISLARENTLDGQAAKLIQELKK